MSEEDPSAVLRERITLWQALGCVGCAGAILLVFAMLGITVWNANRRFTADPAQVEATLGTILACELPPGYQGFRGARVGDDTAIAVLVPADSQGGNSIRLDVPLIISAWSFPAATSPEDRWKKVRSYWEGVLKEQEKKPLQIERKAKLTLTIRKGESSAEEEIWTTGALKLRWILTLIPRREAGKETIALGFLGQAKDFDQQAMDRFLKSIR